MVYVRQFFWSIRNITHISRHQVTPDEVAYVCQTKHVTRESYDHRLLIIGKTEQERILAVVLEKLPNGVYFPVTARPASRKERQEFFKYSKGGENK